MEALVGLLLSGITSLAANVPALYKDYLQIKSSFSPQSQAQLDAAFQASGIALDADVTKLDADVAARDAAGS